MRIYEVVQRTGGLVLDARSVYAVRWMTGVVQSHPARVDVLTPAGWQTIATFGQTLWGNPEEDAAAQEFAMQLAREVWPNDSPYRLGGET